MKFTTAEVKHILDAAMSLSLWWQLEAVFLDQLVGGLLFVGLESGVQFEFGGDFGIFRFMLKIS